MCETRCVDGRLASRPAYVWSVRCTVMSDNAPAVPASGLQAQFRGRGGSFWYLPVQAWNAAGDALVPSYLEGPQQGGRLTRAVDVSGFVRLYADRAVQGQYVPAPPGWHVRIGNGNLHAPVALWQIMSHGAAVPMVSVEESETATLRSVYELDEATELVEPFDIDLA